MEYLLYLKSYEKMFRQKLCAKFKSTIALSIFLQTFVISRFTLRVAKKNQICYWKICHMLHLFLTNSLLANILKLIIFLLLLFYKIKTAMNKHPKQMK